ncbi:MAG: sigma-70 family RNA polymerase sigma factor [Planctomycetes bacterium]|nr:sigma-70 family RNA polymerase sigma factor [Planctomycetota bacterium]
MEPRRTSPHPGPAPAADDPLAALVLRVAEGDEAAFRELYDALSPRVNGLALRILRDRAAAEEAVVDVFTQVWKQAARHDPAKGSVASWVLTVARTRAIDLSRIQKRRSRRETGVDPEAIEALPDPTEGPITAAVGDEHARVLRAALERLPREQRAAVELAFFSGFSHTEVASALRAPLGTVKTRIRTGLSTLRTTLASVEGDLR